MFRKKPSVITIRQVHDMELLEKKVKESDKEKENALEFFRAFRITNRENGFTETFRKAIGDTSGH